MSAFRVVMVTSPQGHEEELAKKIMENNLAACINIVSNVKSTYRWKGEVKTDNEGLLIIKTTTKKVESLIKFIKVNHSYDIPEVVSLTIAEGNPDYLDWLDAETAG